MSPACDVTTARGGEPADLELVRNDARDGRIFSRPHDIFTDIRADWCGDGRCAVDLPPGYQLSFEDRPSQADRNAIGMALDVYNRTFLGETGFSRVCFFVRNERGEIMAGLVGSAYARCLFVADLWVHAELRRRGIGSELLARAERRAIELGCHSVWLDTFSFQAPEFYPRFGYEVFGTLDHPPDHRRIFLWKQLLAVESSDSLAAFPISIKGVLLDGGRVMLLENERQQWELPGGRLERGEEPAACLAREFAEELGAEIAVGSILDCWVYEVLPQKQVAIVTYGVRRLDRRAIQVSREHRRFGLFAIDELAGLPMPEGYRRSIRAWAAQCTG
jgi:8-oxo-dGTP pyrophosphatase MutT (NUDIX family)/GNAT superfamily N-acetyltransferase